ncbi:MAG: class I SAM-dependent methyltransferase [Verrucomicrobiae bacterium]|nr:class I SAM-dependent methyltransferase [Verrucomicrobiae bacterium]
MFSSYTLGSHVARLAHVDKLEGKLLDQALIEIHQAPFLIENGGRNVAAGYLRACGLSFGKLYDAVKEDPLYQQAFHLMHGGTLLSERLLMNFFLLLKYSIKEMPGDIIEFGSYRCGMALFLAYVARGLGIKGKVYALDTFEGIPHADGRIDFHACGDFKDTSFDAVSEIIQTLHLDNLILVKGSFQYSFPKICSMLQPLSLVHVDGVTYSSVKYAINAALPHMHSRGGYLVIDDALCSSCIGALQATEEMVQEYHLNAEQNWPHLVYRYAPPLNLKT